MDDQYQLFADVVNSLGVVGIVLYSWWISRQDMKDERARMEKQRQDDLARIEKQRQDDLTRYEREITAAFARYERDLQFERNRADKWQTAIISQLKRTNVPDATEPSKEAIEKRGL